MTDYERVCLEKNNVYTGPATQEVCLSCNLLIKLQGHR